MGIEQTMFAGRFGGYVRERREARPAQDCAEIPYPLPQETRDVIAHHLIPLALLARADGDTAAAEQKVMLDHAAAMLTRSGHPVSDADRGKLRDYVAGFRPSLMQLDPALHRIEREDADTKIAFLGAARAIANADGRITDGEARLLDELKLEFARA
ncbi:MAG TPA: TerB family tellurite resistance protein [Rhizomicrobium sp.]|nr:TerB family tellurite resistance protein [Rhizomicrobium sp.]